jgi:hypothetical protein
VVKGTEKEVDPKSARSGVLAQTGSTHEREACTALCACACALDIAVCRRLAQLMKERLVLQCACASVQFAALHAKPPTTSSVVQVKRGKAREGPSSSSLWRVVGGYRVTKPRGEEPGHMSTSLSHLSLKCHPLLHLSRGRRRAK